MSSCDSVRQNDRRRALGPESYVCRICLQFTDSNMEKIYLVAKKVHDGDGLPAYICSQCKFELIVSHGFIQRSVTNDSILRSRCQESRQGISTKQPAASFAVTRTLVCIAPQQAVAEPIFEVKTEPQESNTGHTPETDPLLLGDEKIQLGTVRSTDQHFSADGILSTIKPESPQDPLQLLADAIDHADSDLNVTQSFPPLINCNSALPIEDDIAGHSSYITALVPPSSSDIEVKTEVPTDSMQFSDNGNDNGFSNYYSGVESPNALSEMLEAASAVEDIALQNERQISTAGVTCPNKKKNKQDKKSFSCNLCDATFKVRTYLNLHLRSHSSRDKVEKKRAERAQVVSQDVGKASPKLYQCPTCDKSFVREKNMTNHAQTHTKSPKLYQCPICDMSFMSKEDMTNHAPTHLKPVSVKMTRFNTQTPANPKDFDGSKQPEKKNEQAGFKLNGEERSTLTCGQLGEYFAKQKLMVRHLNIHIERKLYKCNECNKEFFSEASLASHAKCHQVRSKQPITNSDQAGFELKAEEHSTLTCDQCGESFQKRKLMVKHLQIHIKQKLYKCNECNKEFHKPCHLASHVKCHAQKPPYKCSTCLRVFADNIGLMAHEILTHRRRESSFDCAVCAKSLKTAKSLRRHMKKHGKKTRYTCGDCNRHFCLKSSLTLHMQVMHLVKENNYACLNCKKDYRDKACLTLHLKYSTCRMCFSCQKCSLDFETKEIYEKHMSLTHASDVRLYCEICKIINTSQNKTKLRTFMSNIHLIKHITRVHSAEKFKCNICKRSFKYQKSLDKHILKCTSGEASLTCPICQQTYSNIFSLKRHMFTHTDAKRFKCQRCLECFLDVKSVELHMASKRCTPVIKCPKCPKSFTRVRSLVQHTSTCHKESTYNCYRCEKPFSDRLAMENHFYKVICEGAFKCKTCLKTYSDQNNLSKHIKRMHSEKQLSANINEYPCSHCKQSFRRSQTLESHVYRWHMNLRNFRCQKCGEKFADAVSLDEHKMLKVCEARFKCRICSKEFLRTCELVRHLHVHTKSFPCNCCDKPFKWEKSLLRHKLVVHFGGGDTKVLCDVCGMPFSRLADLQSHITIHELNKHRIFTCGNCGEEFKDKTTLSSHMVMHSVEEKAIKLTCPKCGKIYGNQQRLLNHTVIVHNGHRPFACDTCGRSFATKDKIIKHVKCHLEKRLKCYICEKGYMVKSAMRIHMRKHTGEKPFGCELCGETFVSNFRLKCHSQVHGKKKRFECNLCKESFSSKKTLIIHLHKHTEKQPFTCEVCTAGFRQKGGLVRHQQRQHPELFPSNDSQAAEKLPDVIGIFPCNICPEVLTTHGKLLSHKSRVHFKTLCQNFEPKICEICGFAFLSKRKLNDHSVFGHTIKLSHTCNLCSKTFVSSSLVKSHLQRYHIPDFEEIPQ